MVKAINKLTISNIPEISAIYFALLQCGYDYYTIERSHEHNEYIRRFIGLKNFPSFFYEVKQSTCEVYPYWPRAAILEMASFYLLSDRSQFRDYDKFRKRVMSAGNILDCERDQKLWEWIRKFPEAISKVLADKTFQRYLKWERQWITEQNNQQEAELERIQDCLDVCISKYGSSVFGIQIVVNPIKCVYSADYHWDGDHFIFCSGAFRPDSVIHEFLHHVLHLAVIENREIISSNKRKYPGIDDSYYLSGDGEGQLNAFEEYAVREMTKGVIKGIYPNTIRSFLKELI